MVVIGRPVVCDAMLGQVWLGLFEPSESIASIARGSVCLKGSVVSGVGPRFVSSVLVVVHQMVKHGVYPTGCTTLRLGVLPFRFYKLFAEMIDSWVAARFQNTRAVMSLSSVLNIRCSKSNKCWWWHLLTLNLNLGLILIWNSDLSPDLRFNLRCRNFLVNDLVITSIYELMKLLVIRSWHLAVSLIVTTIYGQGSFSWLVWLIVCSVGHFLFERFFVWIWPFHYWILIFSNGFMGVLIHITVWSILRKDYTSL